jgi:hypothetical protein
MTLGICLKLVESALINVTYVLFVAVCSSQKAQFSQPLLITLLTTLLTEPAYRSHNQASRSAI